MEKSDHSARDEPTPDPQADPQQDRSLVQGALAGDQGSLEILVTRLIPIIQKRTARVCRRRFPASRSFPGRSDLEDLVQEILISFFLPPRHLEKWRPERGLDLPAFVDMVTRRRVLNLLESKTHRPRQALPLESARESPRDSGLTETSPGAERKAVVRSQLDGLLTALERNLSADRYFLFELYYVQEKSVTEIGEIMNLAPSVIHNRLHRLRGVIKEIAEGGKRELSPHFGISP